MTHAIAFTAPQPFWRPGTPASRGAIVQPQILRFATDEFIEELLATLERDPGALPQYAAQPETWREPMGAPAPDPLRWTDRQPTRLLPLLRRRAAKAGVPAVVAPKPLKLYQPAHQRHYLVAASLVCRRPGLPDRAVDPARQSTSLVMRRLFPRDSEAPAPLPDIADLSAWDEYAWVLTGKTGEWRHVGPADAEGAAATLLVGEERLPTFPARYHEVAGQPRRLAVGSVPVGRRETYQGAQRRGGSGPDPVEPDPRGVMFRMQVLGPWKALVTSAMLNGAVGGDPDDLAALKAARLPRIFPKKDDGYDTDKPDLGVLRAERARLQTASWFLLLDLLLFLREQLPAFWNDHVLANQRPADAALRAFWDALAAVAMPVGLVTDSAGNPATLASPATPDDLSLAEQCPGYAVLVDLLAALRRAAAETEGALDFEGMLEAAPDPLALPSSGRATGWPSFLYLFADPWFGIAAPPEPAAFEPTATDYLAERITARIDTLAELLEDVLAQTARATAKLPEPGLAARTPADLREAWYRIRFVHERPDCAPFEDTLVSRATVPFQMAGFFDPDAPARPIRIGLPLDISPAGLRKFDKNAVFVMSDMLCGHLDRFKGMTFGDLVLSVLPWPFHKGLDVPDKGPCKQGGLELGVMCSLSIPIITICALILLMIIVALLDLIFRWLPLFVVCFPLPGFKGKKGSGS
ncbi:hypothetical protein [Piscinibacter defluvii]|uniref:hypothetical protein n=1 Tax=Piscinibacter defluvii TaxID=1796922 RepID=UPI000FDD8FE1|nr:hypothetical protein [Piscinibacter defluvii]